MNILVTGGLGFAGHYVSEFLVNQGYNVTATYRSGKPDDTIEGIDYIRQELSQPIRINKQFDAIIHTACSRSGGTLNMEEYIRDNVDSARQLVDFAKRTGTKTIVYFSTRSVYGEIRLPEANEDCDIINSNKYGLSKYIAEFIFREANDLNTIGFRTPGIIGPGAHDIWLVDIVNKIRRGEDVCVSNFATQNLVHILDICKFIHKLLGYGNTPNQFKYKIVNLACMEKINNVDIAYMIKERLASSSNIYVKKPDKGLFIMKANRAFEMGFRPMTPTEIVNLYLDYVTGQTAIR